MATRAGSGSSWEFDRFELIPEKRLLLSDGTEVPLTSKAFDTLAFLVANRERVVGKDELLRAIWPDVVVEEGNLTQQIFLIRKALGETAQYPRFIVTVPGHGYRFTGSVREASSDRNDTAADVTVPSRRDSAGPSRLAPMVGLLVAATAAILVLVLITKGIVPADRRPRADAAGARMMKLTESGQARRAALSPDGRYVAFAENEGDEYGLVVQQIATGSRTQVVVREPQLLGSLTFSPDGQYLYFTRGVLNKGGFGLHRVPSTGGAEIPVLDDVDTAVSFSPDGRQFVFMRGAGPVTHLVVANADGSGQRVVATRKAPLKFWFAAPSWSPDGKFIAASATDGSPRTLSSIVLIPLDGSATRELYTSEQRIGAVRWLPDGSGVLTVMSETLARQFAPWLTPTVPFSGGPIWRVSYPDGTAERITPDLAEYDLCCVDVSASGSRAVGVLNSLVSDLWIAPADELNALRQIKRDSPILSRHAWLPDNDTVVYRDLAGRLNAVRRTGGEFRLPIPERLKVVGGVSACGDGRYVVFAASPGNNVWRVSPQGGGAEQLTDGSLDSSPACSPDGAWIVYSSLKGEVASLRRMTIDGRTPELLADRGGETFDVLLSPGGGMIYYPAFEWDTVPVRVRRMRWLIMSAADRRRLYTLNAPEETLGIPGVPPAWAPDERGIDYVVTRNGVSNIWRLPLAGGPPVPVTAFNSGEIFTFAWSRDGKWLSLGRGFSRSDVALIAREP